MITHHKVEGYEECSKLISNLKDSGNPIVIYFSGSENEDGVSWCPDCQTAEPIVEEVLQENKDKTFTFVKAAVGPREEWKNPKCPFRTDPSFKLTSVPTLLLYGSASRLNDSECQDVENIKMIFEDIPS